MCCFGWNVKGENILVENVFLCQFVAIIYVLEVLFVIKMSCLGQYTSFISNTQHRICQIILQVLN